WGTCSATCCGFLKTPEPITVPMTTAIAVQGPRARTRREVLEEFDSVMSASLRGLRTGRKREQDEGGDSPRAYSVLSHAQSRGVLNSRRDSADGSCTEKAQLLTHCNGAKK